MSRRVRNIIRDSKMAAWFRRKFKCSVRPEDVDEEVQPLTNSNCPTHLFLSEKPGQSDLVTVKKPSLLDIPKTPIRNTPAGDEDEEVQPSTNFNCPTHLFPSEKPGQSDLVAAKEPSLLDIPKTPIRNTPAGDEDEEVQPLTNFNCPTLIFPTEKPGQSDLVAAKEPSLLDIPKTPIRNTPAEDVDEEVQPLTNFNCPTHLFSTEKPGQSDLVTAKKPSLLDIPKTPIRNTPAEDVDEEVQPSTNFNCPTHLFPSEKPGQSDLVAAKEPSSLDIPKTSIRNTPGEDVVDSIVPSPSDSEASLSPRPDTPSSLLSFTPYCSDRTITPSSTEPSSPSPHFPKRLSPQRTPTPSSLLSTTLLFSTPSSTSIFSIGLPSNTPPSSGTLIASTPSSDSYAESNASSSSTPLANFTAPFITQPPNTPIQPYGTWNTTCRSGKRKSSGSGLEDNMVAYDLTAEISATCSVYKKSPPPPPCPSINLSYVPSLCSISNLTPMDNKSSVSTLNSTSFTYISSCSKSPKDGCIMFPKEVQGIEPLQNKEQKTKEEPRADEKPPRKKKPKLNKETQTDENPRQIKEPLPNEDPIETMKLLRTMEPFESMELSGSMPPLHRMNPLETMEPLEPMDSYEISLPFNAEAPINPVQSFDDSEQNEEAVAKLIVDSLKSKKASRKQVLTAPQWTYSSANPMCTQLLRERRSRDSWRCCITQ